MGLPPRADEIGKKGKKMNKLRRKELDEIIAKIQELQTDLEIVLGDEQEYLDNMPENLQYSERGERAQEAVDALQAAYNNLDECIENIEAAQE